jgi:hypothetical protein
VALALTHPPLLAQYYPPDFDPSLLPRTKKLKNKQQTVNMMMPMSVTCTSCGNYIYRGTKFNSMKETVQGEDYLGIRIFRFYMRCPNCSSEFTIRTDPKNSDYSVELGCTVSDTMWLLFVFLTFAFCAAANGAVEAGGGPS